MSTEPVVLLTLQLDLGLSPLKCVASVVDGEHVSGIGILDTTGELSIDWLGQSLCEFLAHCLVDAGVWY